MAEVMEASKAEVTPSDPSTGGSRDFARSVTSMIAGALVALAGKFGLNLDDAMSVTLAAGIMVFVSQALAKLGKRIRQSESDNGILGQLF